MQSYVSPDSLTCVYISPNERLLREHAVRGNFPLATITEVLTVIDPTTAEAVKVPASGPRPGMRNGAAAGDRQA